MKQVTLGRKLFILAVTLICLRLVYPSVRYLIALRETAPTGAEELKKWDEKLESLRESAIPLGLDLRGGVDVSLMIDEDEAVKSSVQNMVTTLKTDFADKKVSVAVGATTDGKKLSVKVLDKADARAVYNALGNYAGQIEGDFSQAKLETGEEILLTMNERSRQQNMKNNIEGAMRVIRERLDKFGLTQPSIAIQGGNRLRIQVAGEKDPDRLIGNITKLAAMEFRLAHEAYGTASDPINSLLDENGELKPDAIVPLGYEVIPYNFRKVDPKTDQISSRKGKMLVEREVKIRGDELRNTGFHQDPMDIANPIKVDIQFKDHGAKIFGDITTDSSEKAKQDGHARNLAIILDGEVISAPEMKVPITSGSAVIEGGFRQADAQDLSQLLKAGSLPAPLKVESKRTVGASLGTESIFGGVRALVYGTVVIIIFMIAYYGVAGVISIIALILNVLIVLAILQLAKATLTLSGIGGILLTVGMAVDTNVLIYERMREELAAGRPLKQAIALGFDRAFAVIIDSHMTTLVTALLLLQFTEGSVFGFALTMTFGIIANLYTGLIVTYTLCAMWFQWRNSLSLGKLKIFANASFDFIKMRFVTLGISWLIII
ncbi:protein translocase subunit SecD, partial [Candidatus Sumerlaeota bacterium]|nr:protein translocase subunit SecD [Candidatus Sumerlaeota bacterium]